MGKKKTQKNKHNELEEEVKKSTEISARDDSVVPEKKAENNLVSENKEETNCNMLKSSKLKDIYKKFHLRKIALLVFLLTFLLLIIVPIGVYFYGPLGKITRPIFKEIPYPVAFVGESKEMISTKELIQNVDAVRKFYEDQDLANKGMRVDFSTPDGEMRLKIKEKDILDKQVEDRIIEQLGNRNGISITTEDAQRELDATIKKAGSKKAVELRLASLYGWGFDDLRDKVIIYQMYTKELLEKYSEISKKQETYLLIEKARKELKTDGSNFAEIVQKYSEGESAQNKGELGWFPLDKINLEVASEVVDYEKGQISGVITSRLGFHLVQLQDYREIEQIVEEDDEINNLKKGYIVKHKEVKLRQIFRSGNSFVEWIEKEKKKSEVSVWMKEYEWDKDSGHIRFADEKMRLLEERTKVRSKGDPSIK